ncbi:hypothetical protein M2137_000689 [Parabacteroides sp. PFB2-10]|uniref:hypothetical protein n=1 Tax=Parabacteroides sp. PFB2-10 TaxID=1742405 RepID=UPI0024770141|nr:hypothetical protein [Parabacteroides sp. PFB2-10]MDH6311930.1 hypothetical protein [Parabacteroides sp. PFB2-10]
MKKYIYNLQISCSAEEQLDEVSKLLRIEPTKRIGNIWCLEVEETESDEYFDFVDYFLSILEGKFALLELIGVAKSDINIWFLYQYEGQCNIEFSANDLKLLGTSGVRLCISCWPSG